MQQAMISVAGGKILLAKTNWFFDMKSSLFQKFRLQMSGLTCHSTSPLPLRVLLSKRTSRLYESYSWSRAALILREQSDFANFEVLSGPEKSIFHEIWSPSIFAITMSDLAVFPTFSISYGSSWGFACAKLQHQWQLEKYSWRKRIGSFMRNLHFSTEKVHIVCTSLATQHAHCH